MEWMVGESPTDLLSISTGDSSTYSERQKLEAKRRLLDLVCRIKLHSQHDIFFFLNFIIISGLMVKFQARLKICEADPS